MAWFKVDDALAFNMKAVAAGNSALGLWVRAGSWSCQQLTDGFVPVAMVHALGGQPEDADALETSGLWHAADGGYVFHDWEEYQEPSEKVKERRAAARDRMKTVRSKRSQDVRANEPRTNSERAHEVRDVFAFGSPNPDPTRPDPTRPTSSNEEVSGGARALSPFCSKHPNGTDGNCRGCGSARMAFVAAQAAEKNKPTPIPRREKTCTVHAEYPLPCDRCKADALEVAS